MKITGTSIAAMLLLCSLAQAQDNRGLDSRAPENHGLPAEGIHYGWADVLRVDPVYDEQGQPAASHEECYDEQVPVQGPDNRAGATVLGAVIGGVVGSTIGKGNGRTAATVAGATAGAVVGNNAGQPASGYTVERHCRQVPGGAAERRVTGYDVEYRYRGELYNARMSYDPGDRIRVRISVTPAE
ncbi:MAG TPA: glycine zipper 2TM domain-containing protein [Rudaea sp.]|nr:glycine zipper 2TM domain-containing protein [Rudaea sp.]HSC12561.1 glycine zipper 2TM domain-containing protein [Rhodanobacteraceae bacterium]